MAHELIIDLGDDFTPVEDTSHARGSDGRRRRAFLVIAVGIVIAVLLGGSVAQAAPPAPRLATITASFGGVFLVTGSDVVVADVRDGHNAMTAYALPSGRQLWTTTLTVLANDLELERVRNTVLAAFHGFDGAGDQTNAVDLRSGAMLWHTPGELIKAFPRAGTALVAINEPDGNAQYAMIDAGTGQARWVDQEVAGCNSNLDVHLVELCADTAELTVVDLDSGRVQATKKVDLGADYGFTGRREPIDEIKLAEQDGVIVVGHLGNPGPWMDAYRVDDLTHLWRQPYFDSAYIQPCGQIFCISDGRISTGLDPHTGATLPFNGFDPAQDAYPDGGPWQAGPGDRIALIPAGSSPMRYDGSAAGTPDESGYPNATSVPTYPDSQGINVPGATRVNVWIASVHTTPKPHPEVVVTPVQRLPDVGVRSCVLVKSYLACAIDPSQMIFYDVSKLTK